MLNKMNRIGNRNVIEKLFQKGKLYKDELLVFKYEKVENAPSQFAIAVGKKIHKKAVQRNKLRRQIHEALRVNLPALKTSIIALVIARPPCQKTTFLELNKSINTFFNTSS